jgi:hypothetical protein
MREDDMIGNGNANAIFTKTLESLADTKMPLLALNWSGKPIAGELPTLRYSKARVTVDANGGAVTSKLLVTITIKTYDEDGTAGTDITYSISGGAAKAAWSGSSPTFVATAVHMKDVIDLLNEVPGLQSYLMHCPYYLSVDTDDFIDVAVTDIPMQPGKFLNTLYRDVDASLVDTDKYVAFMRIGIPELRDAGSMQLIRLTAAVTGATGGKVRLYRDLYSDFSKEYSATHATCMANKQMYVNETLVDTTLTDYVDKDISNAMTIQGPVVLEISSTDLTACTAEIAAIQANI